MADAARRRTPLGARAPAGVDWRGELEGQRLGAAVDLGAAVLVKRLDRRAGKRVVGREQPAESFLIVESAVEQDRQRAGQALDDLPAVEERGGDRAIAAWAGDREELAVAEELLYPADGETKPGGHLGEGQPFADEGVSHGVYLCHESNVPRLCRSQTPDIPLQSCIFPLVSGARTGSPRHRAVGQPARGGRQALRADGEQHPTPGPTAGNEPGFLEDRQVLRDRLP